MKYFESQTDIQALFSRTKKLEWVVKLLLFLWLITVIFFVFSNLFWQVKSEGQPKSLTLNRLTIVDENGTERVVIAGSVPEPIILGKRLNTGRKASGILLLDEEGNERSGYITTNGYPNVLFGLDSLGRQQSLFLTEPHGSTAFWIWGDNNNAFKVSVGSDSSKFEIIKNGKASLEIPERSKKQEDKNEIHK